MTNISKVTALAILTMSKLANRHQDLVFCPKTEEDINKQNEKFTTMLNFKLMDAGINTDDSKDINLVPNSPVANCAADMSNGATDELSTVISTTLASEINLYRNTVRPLIKEYYDMVTKHMNDNYSLKGVYEKNAIREIYAYSIVDKLKANNYFVFAYTDAIPVSNLSLSYLTFDEAVRVIKDKFNYYSANAEEFLESYSEMDWDKFKDNYLNHISNMNTELSNIGYDTRLKYKDIIFLTLLSDALIDNPNEAVNVSLKEYNDMLKALRNKCAGILDGLHDAFKKSEEEGTVIISAREEHGIKVTTVFKLNYEKLLEDTDVMAVFGATLDSGRKSIDDIKSNADEYINKWEEYVATEQAFNASKESSRYMETLKVMLIELLTESEDLEEFDGAAAKRLVYGDVSPYLLEIANVNQDNLQEVCKDIIAGILYKDTNAKRYIDYMNYFGSRNKNLRPENAAAFASFYITIDWIINQIQK